MPISGRADSRTQEAYPPARSTASAGYAASCEYQFHAVFFLASAVGMDSNDLQQPIKYRGTLATFGLFEITRDRRAI
jgi:hypothetical protein